MGKRELVLIVAFVIVGAVVYQATAPPPGPDDRGFSLSGVVAKLRREIRGNRARAEASTVTTHELDPTTTELRLAGAFAEVTITGQKRSDVEAKLRVTSTGYDDPEARQLAEATHLKVDRAGGALRLTASYPEPGQQRAFLTLAVPARLAIRIEPGAGRTTLTNLSTVEATVRGETTIKNIAGRVTLTHRAGKVLVDGAAALKLSARGSDANVTNISGEASFSMQSGELAATALGGPVEVDSQGSDIVLKKLDDSPGPVRMTSAGGSILLEGLGAEARIDGRNTEIQITMSKPAPLAVYSEGDEPIAIVTPPGGFVIDALTTQAKVAVEGTIQNQVRVSNPDGAKEQRANGAVRGGGPTITVRANRGDISIK